MVMEKAMISSSEMIMKHDLMFIRVAVSFTEIDFKTNLTPVPEKNHKQFLNEDKHEKNQLKMLPANKTNKSDVIRSC